MSLKDINISFSPEIPSIAVEQNQSKNEDTGRRISFMKNKKNYPNNFCEQKILSQTENESPEVFS